MPIRANPTCENKVCKEALACYPPCNNNVSKLSIPCAQYKHIVASGDSNDPVTTLI